MPKEISFCIAMNGYRRKIPITKHQGTDYRKFIQYFIVIQNIHVIKNPNTFMRTLCANFSRGYGIENFKDILKKLKFNI